VEPTPEEINELQGLPVIILTMHLTDFSKVHYL